jgi:hypothetical protein
MRWENPLLSALIQATRDCSPKLKSREASAFIGAIHRMVSTLAHLKESLALSALGDDVARILKLMPEETWTPGSAGTECLQALVHALRDLPNPLANIQKTLLEKRFINQGQWEKLLLDVQGTSS